jgi:hypothetical protein
MGSFRKRNKEKLVEYKDGVRIEEEVIHTTKDIIFNYVLTALINAYVVAGATLLAHLFKKKQQ